MNPLSRTAGPEAAGADNPATQRAWKAARQFEAQMIEMLLGPVEKSFAAVPGGESDPGADSFETLGLQALASQMAAAGGLGLAALVIRKLDERGRLHGDQPEDVRLKFAPAPPIV